MNANKPFRTYLFSWSLSWFQILFGSALIFIPQKFTPHIIASFPISPSLYGWFLTIIGLGLYFSLLFAPNQYLNYLNYLFHWLSGLLIALIGWQFLVLGQLVPLGLPFLIIALFATLTPFLPQRNHQAYYFDISILNLATISIVLSLSLLIYPQPDNTSLPVYSLLTFIAALLLLITQFFHLQRIVNLFSHLTAIVILAFLLLPHLVNDQLNTLEFVSIFLLTSSLTLYWDPKSIRGYLDSLQIQLLTTLFLLSFILLGLVTIITDTYYINPFQLALYAFGSTLIVSVFTAIIANPLIKLQRAVLHHKLYPSDQPIPPRGPAEIKSLIQSFNQLNHQIYSSRANLEQQIQTRTQQLAHSKSNLTQTLNQLKAILQATEAPLIALNPQGKIIIFNQAATQLTGISGRHAYGKKPAQLLHLMNQNLKPLPPSQSPFIQVIKTNQHFSLPPEQHFYINDVHHQSIPVQLSISPVLDPRKQIIGVVCIIHDISVSKRLQELQNEFVFIAAHELKNPVAAIAGYLEMAQEATSRSPKIKTALNAIAQANLRLTILINNLLQVARFESGKINPQLTPLKPKPLLDQIIEQHQPLIKTKSIKLLVRFSQKIQSRQVLADPDFLGEIFNNLIINALKYTSKNGSVAISHQLSRHARQYKKPSKSSSAKYLIINIQDTGCGIPESEQNQVFNKFFRASNSAGAEGNGLGLFIVKRLVEKMNGYIWFKSQESQGSTFSFSVPLVANPQKSPKTTSK